MKPGIHHDVSFAEYANIKAFSNSWAGYLAECPAILKANMDYPDLRDTPALKLGRAVHEAVFDKQAFQLEVNFKIMPKFGRTKIEQEAKKEFEERYIGKTLITEDDYYEALSIADAVRGTNTAKKLFSDMHGIDSEVTLVWNCAKTGVLCKGRMDAWNEDHRILFDLKTTSDSLHDDSLARVMNARKYYRQLAWYTMGLEALGQDVAMQVLIFVQKRKPYPVRFKAIDFEAIEQGRREMNEFVAQYAECLSTDKWPSYPDKISSLGLPAWAKKYENSNVDFENYEDAANEQ